MFSIIINRYPSWMRLHLNDFTGGRTRRYQSQHFLLFRNLEERWYRRLFPEVGEIGTTTSNPTSEIRTPRWVWKCYIIRRLFNSGTELRINIFPTYLAEEPRRTNAENSRSTREFDLQPRTPIVTNRLSPERTFMTKIARQANIQGERRQCILTESKQVSLAFSLDWSFFSLPYVLQSYSSIPSRMWEKDQRDSLRLMESARDSILRSTDCDSVIEKWLSNGEFVWKWFVPSLCNDWIDYI